MGLRSRVERLVKALGPANDRLVVATLRCLGNRVMTRQSLADFAVASSWPEGGHPLGRLIADTYFDAVMPKLTDEELEEWGRADVEDVEVPIREAWADAGEAAVRELDAAIARGEHPELAEVIADWERAHGTAGGLAAGRPSPSEPVALVRAALAEGREDH